MKRPTVRKAHLLPRGGEARRITSAQELKREAALREAEDQSGHWTFLTNHAHVLILLAQNPSIVLREVATLVGITERAVQRIIADLEEEGFIQREKVGRQNHYRIIRERKLNEVESRLRSLCVMVDLLQIRVMRAIEF